MPAQSGDPISSALQVSLANSNSKKEEKDVSLLLSYSAKQILLTEIKYEEFNYDSTSFLNSLKSKYTLISEKDTESTDSDSKQSTNSQQISSSNSVKSLLSTSNNSERLKSVERVSNNFDRTENRSKPSLPTPNRTLWPQDAVSLGWKPNTPVGGGFINLWNSCYINSTLQALFHIPGLVNWLLMDNSHKCPTKSSTECLICAMTQTLKNSQESTGKAIKPYLIYSRLKSICKHLYPGAQEDAHEFLRHLVDSLDRTYLTPFKDLRLDHLSKETTPLSQIFGGYLRNEVVCQACGHISTTFQYFQDLPLDIANSSHLDGALEMFFARESVSEHEGYKCEHCKRRVPFTKKFSLEKSPRVLCVQLKRFGAVSGKNNKSISIAGKLNLNRFRAVKNGDSFEPYHLAAVVNHIGTSANCGHYTAIAMAADNKFYLFDDQRVERLHDLAQNSSQAYILLYHQKPNVPNGIKPDLSSKLALSNTMKGNSVGASSGSHESAKERLFGKNESNSKNPFKIFNNSIITKVTSTVGNSISNMLTKVNGSGVSCSMDSCAENNSEKHASHSHTSSPNKSHANATRSDFIGPLKPDGTSENSKKRDATNEKISSYENSSNPRLQNGHKSDVANTSLVPYNESSCSSDDGSYKGEESRSTTPKHRSSNNDAGPPNKKPRFDSTKDSSQSRKIQTNGSNGEKNGTSPSYNRLSNGHSSPAKPKYSNGNSNNGVNYGKYNRGWTVTSRSPSTSPSKSQPPKHNWKVKGLEESRNDYKSQLMSMGHRGYGKPVMSWCSEKSEMEKEVKRDAYNMNERLSSSYNDKYDMPNNKIKKYHNGGGSNYENKNRFNQLQKRKNNWYSKSMGRQHYYSADSRQSNGDSFYHNKYRPWNHI